MHQETTNVGQMAVRGGMEALDSSWFEMSFAILRIRSMYSIDPGIKRDLDQVAYNIGIGAFQSIPQPASGPPSIGRASKSWEEETEGHQSTTVKSKLFWTI